MNEGIGGNRVNTRTGANSPVAVDRLDRDVLARSGVTHVMLFEGTNDLASGLATSDSVMTGIHPNPYGYLLMGKAIDVSIFDDRDDDRDRDDD